ncbi:hypothetical protein [Shewanella gelidii]|uniref:Uncharacterized protein n=1 Tax=Shewanella gelidii TaxID=1642821 RepID=A0A917JKM9_9GAMM|nr:hypothetical protein [Shewanella gelidii]MCL1096931.1 hypothetical protein [Shewanella gelidii]GGI71303.1 hypothetical protein GCM10009332_05740 [Shewanella gelidii]
MANKSKKNKNYQARKDIGPKPSASQRLSMGFGLDPETGKVKNVKMVTIMVVAAILLFVGVRIWAGYQAANYDETAKPYMRQAIPEISKWDADVMKSYMAPETLVSISEYDFLTMMNSLKKLGPLISIEDPEFQSVNTVKSRDGVKSVVVTYAIEARYLNGDADLVMALKQKIDGYEVYRFNVDSKALSQ